jgi:gas vesicle protein
MQANSLDASVPSWYSASVAVLRTDTRKRRNNDMKVRDFLGGVVIGAIIGAALGLLFAPQAGKETREDIRDYADEMGEKVREGSRHLAESSRDLAQKGQSQVMAMVDRAKGAVAPGGEA